LKGLHDVLENPQHKPALPADSTLQDWYREFWPVHPSATLRQEARLLTALLAHYHGVSVDTMRRGVSEARKMKKGALRACSDPTRPLDQATFEFLLLL
jgi:hypothetical protein